MQGNIEYQEDFVKDHVLNDVHSITYVLEQIREVHSPEAGWIISDPVITPNADGKTVTIRVHLMKEYVEEHRRVR